VIRLDAAAPPHDDANGADEIEERARALMALLKSLEIDVETMWHAPAKTVVELHECVAAWRDVAGNCGVQESLCAIEAKRTHGIVDSGERPHVQSARGDHQRVSSRRQEGSAAIRLPRSLLKEKLHVKQGAVNPFAIRHSPADVELWIGDELLDDAVSHWLVHPMTNNATVRVKREDFLRFFAHFGAEIHRL
jgi:hypothetical protein